jgi:hypothetical protein
MISLALLLEDKVPGKLFLKQKGVGDPNRMHGMAIFSR